MDTYGNRNYSGNSYVLRINCLLFKRHVFLLLASLLSE